MKRYLTSWTSRLGGSRFITTGSAAARIASSYAKASLSNVSATSRLHWLGGFVTAAAASKSRISETVTGLPSAARPRQHGGAFRIVSRRSG